jgi:DHA1 family multidrug resistance protein-like MFS transporter
VIDWRRNLLFLWLSQVLSLLGFGFALPFVPFYLQELGVQGEQALRLWSGLFGAAAGIPLAVMTPVWGVLSDRYGRKPMILRANLGGAAVLLGMGLVHSPGGLLALRFLQGVFTGTITANLTLVVANTPERKMGLAIGIMNSAVFTGNALGPLAGGFLADLLGFRMAFYLSSLSLGLAFVIAIFLVQEEFDRQAVAGSAHVLRELRVAVRDRRVLAFVALLGLFGLARYCPRPIYALLVQTIAAPGLGVASQTGVLYTASGMAAVLSGILLGRLSDKGRPYAIAGACGVAAGLFLIPQGLVGSVWALIPLCFAADFFSIGVEPVLNLLAARQVPPQRRGGLFGLVGSARSAGWSVGAVMGGTLAAYLGFLSVFVTCAGLFFLATFLLYRLRRVELGAAEGQGRQSGQGRESVSPP